MEHVYVIRLDDRQVDQLETVKHVAKLWENDQYVSEDEADRYDSALTDHLAQPLIDAQPVAQTQLLTWYSPIVQPPPHTLCIAEFATKLENTGIPYTKTTITQFDEHGVTVDAAYQGMDLLRWTAI